MGRCMTLTMPDGAVTIDPHLGILRELRFWDGRKWLDPLQAAAGASGTVDFNCGPCGGTGQGGDSPWELREVVQSGREALARLSLGHVVQGASVEKEVSLRKGEPILYQSHLLPDGQGALTLADHPMVRMERGGRLSFSPKRLALTAGTASEAGPNGLECPAQPADRPAFPGRHGPVDLHHCPKDAGREELVTLLEAEGNPLGWTAVLRHAEQDIVFVLRDPEALPVTILRRSDGGRILGIGDGCAARAGGEVGCAAQPCPLALAPRGGQTVRHAIGAVPCPESWTHVTGISIDQNTLRLEGDGDAVVCLPFDGRFFERGA